MLTNRALFVRWEKRYSHAHLAKAGSEFSRENSHASLQSHASILAGAMILGQQQDRLGKRVTTEYSWCSDHQCRLKYLRHDILGGTLASFTCQPRGGAYAACSRNQTARYGALSQAHRS